MKTITSAKELGTRIAEKLGLCFEANTYQGLADFVEEVVPAIGEEFVGGKTSFDDFWVPFSDDSPIPFWQIAADKKTLRCIMEKFGHKDTFGDVTYFADDFETESEDLGGMPEEGEVIADIEPNGSAADALEWLQAFSKANSLTFSFKLYNLYPLYEHFTAKLGQDANEIVWRIENGKISGNGQEVVVFDGAEGDLLLAQCRWLSGLEPEKMEKYGLRILLETSEEAPMSWKLRDCGLSTGLRLKYGK